MTRVAVLDYGSGNVRSVLHTLERAGATDPLLISDMAEAVRVPGLIVPGVGAYGSVMRLLRECGADQVIRERVANGRATLGICVGLQVLFAGGVEGQPDSEMTPGLGYLPGVVSRLDAPIVPHMGWSPIQVDPQMGLTHGLGHERFYFLHSYAATPSPQLAATGARIATAEHGHEFVAAIELGALAATQFHPEKSGAAGVQLLRNWMESFAKEQTC